MKTATKAKERKDAAESACLSDRAKQPQKNLDQVAHQLAQYSHRLRGSAARKKIDEAIREPFAIAADAIADDAKTLRSALICPDDAI